MDTLTMDMPVILSQMGMLFIIVIVGYVVGKLKILPDVMEKGLSRLVLLVTLPAKVLSSVMGDEVGITGGEAAYFILLTMLVFAIAHLIAIPVARLLGGKREDRGTYGFIASYGNVGFMGLPVTFAIFGAASTFYVSLINLPFTLTIFSVGIILIAGRGKKFDFKILLSPAMVAIYIAIVIFLTGATTPAIIANTASMIGGMTSPAAMLIIGLALARVPIKAVFFDWRLYPMTFLKLIGTPVVTWLILRMFVTDTLMLNILVVISAMPTAATGTMMAMEYGGNERLASSGIFLTTLLSVVTIPLVVLLLLS